MSVTIKQIAERTGLSWPTVSQVLSGKAQRYSPTTRRRVLEAAGELGYRPNAYARAIRAGRFGSAALLLSSDGVRSNLPGMLLRGLCQGLAEPDMNLTLAILPDEKLTSEGFVPKILREWFADGLLINYTDHIPQEMIELTRPAASGSPRPSCRSGPWARRPSRCSCRRSAARPRGLGLARSPSRSRREVPPARPAGQERSGQCETAK